MCISMSCSSLMLIACSETPNASPSFLFEGMEKKSHISYKMENILLYRNKGSIIREMGRFIRP